MVDFSRGRDRGDDRGRDSGRDRGDDRGSRDSGRGARDDYDRAPRDSGRDSSRGGRGGERDGASRGRGSSYTYERRSREDIEKRQSMGANDFDKYLKDGIKIYSPKPKLNRIRILPPTWPKPKHYGHDIFVHFGVGADRGSYLDLDKMKGEKDPITEERDQLRRSGEASEEELKKMDSKRRVLIYLVDRDNEAEGVQAWAMPWTVDRDIVMLSEDRSTNEMLNIDDPEEGYDVEFFKEGEKERTKYTGVAIARRSSRLGKAEWLDYAVDNPLPDQLVFYSYEDIAKAFGGGGQHRERDRDERDGSRDSGRQERGGRDDPRDDDRARRDERDVDRGRGDDRDPPPERSRGRSRGEPELDWDTVHKMTPGELDALVESDQRLHNINVNDAKTDEELADWICEDLKLPKPEATRSRVRAEVPQDGEGDKLAEMRANRTRR